MLDLASSALDQEIHWEERLRNSLWRRKFDLKYLANSPAYLIDIYVLFDQIKDAEFKNEVKTGTGSSLPRHFGEKPNFRVF